MVEFLCVPPCFEVLRKTQVYFFLQTSSEKILLGFKRRVENFGQIQRLHQRAGLPGKVTKRPILFEYLEGSKTVTARREASRGTKVARP